MYKQTIMGYHVYDPLFQNIFTPQNLKESILFIFDSFWVIQTSMGALSNHEDFIFELYVERKHFGWKGGDRNTKCSVIDMFTLLDL